MSDAIEAAPLSRWLAKNGKYILGDYRYNEHYAHKDAPELEPFDARGNIRWNCFPEILEILIVANLCVQGINGRRARHPKR